MPNFPEMDANRKAAKLAITIRLSFGPKGKINDNLTQNQRGF